MRKLKVFAKSYWCATIRLCVSQLRKSVLVVARYLLGNLVAKKNTLLESIVLKLVPTKTQLSQIVNQKLVKRIRCLGRCHGIIKMAKARIGGLVEITIIIGNGEGSALREITKLVRTATKHSKETSVSYTTFILLLITQNINIWFGMEQRYAGLVTT